MGTRTIVRTIFYCAIGVVVVYLTVKAF